MCGDRGEAEGLECEGAAREAQGVDEPGDGEAGGLQHALVEAGVVGGHHRLGVRGGEPAHGDEPFAADVVPQLRS